MDDGLRKVQTWFDNVNRALPEGVSVVPGPNYPAGAPRPLPAHVRELLEQADAAIEKSRQLLRRAKSLIERKMPATAEAQGVMSDINDLLGD